MKKIVLLLLFLISIKVNAQNPNIENRQRLLMDFNWQFSQTDTTNAQQVNMNDSQWRTLDLPHDWSIENAFVEDAPTTGRGGYLPTGIGWYRKHFDMPNAAVGKNIWVEFDGVYQNSDVWLNGQHLGHYPNGYMSFYYDLTPYIKSGENVLVVRVDNSKQPNSRWYTGSGIYRHVWLNIADPLHIPQWGTYITTPYVDSLSSTVQVKTKVENHHKGSKNAILRSSVIDANGKEVAKTESSVALTANENSEIAQHLSVTAPLLWSIETPHMYTLLSQIVENGKVIDETSLPFGIRDIQYDVDKGFLLNGTQVKMNGVCLHHDAGSVGAAVPEGVWVRRLKVLKDMGVNAIRTSHNPVAPEFLDLCDKMGFLVQDEVFDEWTGGKVEFGYSNYFKEWSQHDLTNFILRDRNHPSVVMYSAGNEIGEQKREDGHTILQPLIETFHRLDPTRPVTTGNDNIAADGGSAKLPFLNMLDIVGYNYVDRWHERRELFYSVDRHDHPNWRMVGTESVSIPGVRGGYYGGSFYRVDSSVVVPANLGRVIRAEQLWKFVSSHDYVIGDFMWTGIDYIGESRWPSKNSSSGVIDLNGTPKDAFYFYQSQWTKDPMIHMFPHWNWRKEGQIIPVMVYTNCESVELFVNGKSFGSKSLEFPRQGNSGSWNGYERPKVNNSTSDLHLIWDVPYEAGTLKAVGKRGDEIVFEQEIHTTGAPASLRLSVDNHTIEANKTDVAHVTIEVVDSNGYLVPDADNFIQFNIEGAGELIGLDNANPTEHSSMKSSAKKLFNGMAMAIVQSTDKQGKIKIKVTSPGLKEATIEISSQKPKTSVMTVEDLKK